MRRHRWGGSHQMGMCYLNETAAKTIANEMNRDHPADHWYAELCERSGCAFWHVRNESGEYLRA